MSHPIQSVMTLIQGHCHSKHEAPASVAGDQNTSSRTNNQKRRHQETVGQENRRNDDETNKKRNVAKREREKKEEPAEDMRPMVNRRSLPVFETSEAKVVEVFLTCETYSNSIQGRILWEVPLHAS